VGACCLSASAHVPFTQAGGAAEVPALLLGPDPALTEADAPEDADKPQVAVKVPDIGPYLPGGSAAAGAVASSAQLERQQHQQATDSQKAQQLQAAVAGVKSSVDAYNQLLARPHRMAVRP
jgi:hypothetical protein